MKKIKFWIIPALFFAVCSILNLIGCLTEGDLERCTKPALMPLLCLTSIAYLLEYVFAGQGQIDRRRAVLLCAAQLFGFAGDTMLMGKGFIFFASGIGLFLIGHIFYITLFGGISWKGLKFKHWVLAAVGMIACAVGLILIVNVSGSMLAPMGIYGLTLILLIFSGLAGILRGSSVSVGGRCTWWLIFCGALLFTFSDCLVAYRNLHGMNAFLGGFGVMSTYLVAQSLLAIGGLRLIRSK